MALRAVHIYSRSPSPSLLPTAEGWDGLAESRQRPRRAGLGSSSGSAPNGHTTGTEDEDRSWITLRTGEPLASQALRMHGRFVPATSLSNPDIAADTLHSTEQEQESTHEPASRVLTEDTIGAPDASKGSLAALYASLAKEMPSHSSAVLTNEATFTSTSRAPTHRTSRGRHSQLPDIYHDSNHHAHAHDPIHRHRSDWFVSRALNKMRHEQHINAEKRRHARKQSGNPSSSALTTDSPSDVSTENRLCPSCGDPLPLTQTPEAMAQHRQSITHRLGLNAPMSSASGSEAASPITSEAPTPRAGSRQTSPQPDVPDSPAGTSRVATRRRRLSNAPRWKKIRQDNVGYNLLSRMGWKEGMGLGVEEWKWQQLVKEKRRLRVEALRSAVAQSQAYGALDLGNEAAQDVPCLDVEEETHADAETGANTLDWLSLLPRRPDEQTDSYEFGQDFHGFGNDSDVLDSRSNCFSWTDSLSTEEQQLLQSLVSCGQVHPSEIATYLSQIGLSDSHLAYVNANANPVHPDLANPPDILRHPIEIDPTPARQGLGSRRRSRTSEGSIEIRRPRAQTSKGEEEEAIKKSKFTSTPNNTQPKQKKPQPNPKRLTKSQRDLAHDKARRQWLLLRASLS
ncbi:hypothetical protein BCV70DRAFT_200003 [Testicularia cyperi]|uniref:G-patch domain-containing protein n=1 Tax=Testicularia cyperi TaxID=1882483 RepID=A0A317XS92_9BASI|nr:hypothetical protein BCV70DRAFT_200003 [Testicularia cyperi]